MKSLGDRKLIVRRWGAMVRRASACLMLGTIRLGDGRPDHPGTMLSQGSVLAIGAAAICLALRGM